MVVGIVYALLLLEGLILGIQQVRKNRGLDLSVRILSFLAPFALTIAGVAVLREILAAGHWTWNGARLAPVASMLEGYRLYYGPTDGPALNFIYGPVSCLFYLPAALVRSPTLAMVLGAATSVLLFFLPPAVLLLAPLATRPGTPRGTVRSGPAAVLSVLGALALFGFATQSVAGLSYSAFSVHVDAGALCLAAFAVTLSLPSPGLDRRTRLAVAALLTVLAFWTKQTMAPLLALLPLTLALRSGRSTLLRFLRALVVLGALVTGLIFLLLGFDPLVLNVFRLPASHPWAQGSPALALAGALGEMLTLMAPWLVALVYLVMVDSTEARGPVLRAALGRRSVVFAITAAALLPTCLLTRVKQGGDTNSIAPFAYMVLLAVLPALARRAGGLARGVSPSEAMRWRLFLASCLAFLVVQSPLTVDRQSVSLSLQPTTTLAEDVYSYALDNPGRIYFPHHPLSVLKAEKRLYHFDYGLYDRQIAGIATPPEYIRAHLPPRFTAIAVPFYKRGKLNASGFPVGPRAAPDPRLPGFDLFLPAQPGR